MESKDLSHCKDNYKFRSIMFCNPIWRYKCEGKITKGSSHTLAPMFYGWFKLVKNKEARYKVTWFCHDDKSCCVLGDVHDSMKGKHQVLEVWFVFIDIRLTHMEVAFLEDVGFHLPRHALVDDHGGNPDAQMTFPFPNGTTKLYIMLHLERIMITHGCLGKTW